MNGFAGRALHFMWVDLSCHPTFGDAFGLGLDAVPTAVVVSPKKAMWASFFGAFSVSGTHFPSLLSNQPLDSTLFPTSHWIPACSQPATGFQQCPIAAMR
jgi:hypothetical protein